jgi:RNA polymerase sigma-70 factor (sigma-E family)
VNMSPAGDDHPIVALYGEHYRRLVRLAWLLTHDEGRAEELVQDAFVDLHQRWPKLADPSAAVGYLRTSVVNRSRSNLRHLKVVLAHRPDRLIDIASAEADALERLHQQQIIASLHDLPTRQREVLILRYYGQLSEAEIAEVLGISKGAVKSHASRGLHALRPVLQARS